MLMLCYILQSIEDKMRLVQQQQLRKQEVQQKLAQNDMNQVVVSLCARSIRIGSFRTKPEPEDKMMISVQGLQFTVASEYCLSINKHSYTHLQWLETESYIGDM